MDVPSLMRQAAHFYADRTAIITREEELTYAAAWERGSAMSDRQVRDHALGAMASLRGSTAA